MNENELAEKLIELRRAFDESFAEAERTLVDAPDRYLAVTVAGQRFALPATAISGVARGPGLVRLPSARADFLGIAAIKSVAVPVYALARLLAPGGATPSSPWLVTCRSPEPVALAVDDVQGFLSVPRGERRPMPPPVSELVSFAVMAAGSLRPVVDVESFVSSLLARGPRVDERTRGEG